ncbi:MAG: cupin domain-containing protein [Candidatus Zixiibacteriota bacterium]|nr:MAG: cupin domain-containing protein [candidate division Zixibacteria bacterium]
MPKVCVLKEAEKIKKPYTPFPLVNVDGSHVFLGLFEGDYLKHRHPYDEFFYVTSGSIEIELDKETVPLKAGEGFLVRKKTWHKTKAKRKAIVMIFEKQGLQSEFAER